jgi:hypothetical protein
MLCPVVGACRKYRPDRTSPLARAGTSTRLAARARLAVFATPKAAPVGPRGVAGRRTRGGQPTGTRLLNTALSASGSSTTTVASRTSNSTMCLSLLRRLPTRRPPTRRPPTRRHPTHSHPSHRHRCRRHRMSRPDRTSPLARAGTSTRLAARAKPAVLAIPPMAGLAVSRPTAPGFGITGERQTAMGARRDARNV